LVRNAKELRRRVWKAMECGDAIDKIIYWLEKARSVAENKKSRRCFRLLISYYKTGSLQTWDTISRLAATEGNIDYINSFIEVYNDPLGYRGRMKVFGLRFGIV
jgi:dipeptidyl-peptidase-3